MSTFSLKARVIAICAVSVLFAACEDELPSQSVTSPKSHKSTASQKKSHDRSNRESTADNSTPNKSISNLSVGGFAYSSSSSMEELWLKNKQALAASNNLDSSRPILDQVDVILIHGFSTSTSDGMNSKYGDSDYDRAWKAHSQRYWKYYTDEILINNPRVLQLYWSSRDRLEEGIIQSVVEQLLEAKRDGFCAKQCILISHSAGGLVAEYLLSTASDSRGGRQDYQFIADRLLISIQLGSAVGGSALATHYVDWYSGASCDKWLYKVVHPIADWISPHDDCGIGIEHAGATLDLTPTAARNLNGANRVDVPTLMVAGSGWSGVMGAYLKKLIPAVDDSFVGMHSACGANTATPIESCSSSISHDGELKPVKGPSGLYRNHFPWFMTEEDHAEMIGRQRSPDPSAHEIPIQIDQYSDMKAVEKEEGLIWKETHRYIQGDHQTSAQLIYQHLKI